MATITDVARVAGVSKNTVSRYLNERGYMSEKTKSAIQDAIDLLHYQPNQIARSLTTKRTNLSDWLSPMWCSRSLPPWLPASRTNWIVADTR